MHEIFGSPDIGGNRAGPAPVLQPFLVIVWDAQQHQGRDQIGEGCQRDRVVGNPTEARSIADEEVYLVFQGSSEPSGPIDSKVEFQRSAQSVTEHAFQ